MKTKLLITTILSLSMLTACSGEPSGAGSASSASSAGSASNAGSTSGDASVPVEGNVAPTLSFEEWAAQDLQWPEWAEPVPFDISEDIYAMPDSPRRALGSEEIETIVGQYRYLIETYDEQDKELSPNYYAYRDELSYNVKYTDAYHVAYKLFQELSVLPGDTVVSARMDEGKLSEDTVADYNFFKGEEATSLNFTVMMGEGYYEEAREVYDNELKANIMNREEMRSSQAQQIAWALHRMGDTQEAKEIFDFWVVDHNGKNYSAIATTTTACAFYYSIGEYDKVLETAEYFLAKGADTTVAAKKYYADNLESKYFRDHWATSYAIIEAYTDLAKEAKDGNVVDLENLNDGTYTAAIRGFKGIPIDVEVVIAGGAIGDVTATQTKVDGMVLDDRAGGSLGTIPKRIMEAQSFDVDVVTSATISSESVKIAVTNALLQASK